MSTFRRLKHLPGLVVNDLDSIGRIDDSGQARARARKKKRLSKLVCLLDDSSERTNEDSAVHAIQRIQRSVRMHAALHV